MVSCYILTRYFSFINQLYKREWFFVTFNQDLFHLSTNCTKESCFLLYFNKIFTNQMFIKSTAQKRSAFRYILMRNFFLKFEKMESNFSYFTKNHRLISPYFFWINQFSLFLTFLLTSEGEDGSAGVRVAVGVGVRASVGVWGGEEAPAAAHKHGRAAQGAIRVTSDQ